ncbi:MULTISPECIES: response regulator [Aliivibrio]|uniref:Response regulator n=1 Tax=Aliivibrio fischeri TaxID=668 RepID=A0A510UD72_ALIFS|nr:MULTISPECIES: response regulator [Aliivibrio]MBD1567920.1 response regulator [Aliivibrio sp. S10_S31]MCE4934192.1 response regulator [Aliivibrio fischeri]MCE7534600.1 response regulator [Aliivibrio fischeri]MCE7554052.1 response regulator [Aliivibrio fischeri]MCE7557564.1 response regulator [Aliivibrio fischeri]
MEKLNLICVDDQREVLSAVLQDLAPLKSWVNIEECESADEALDLLDELDSEGGYIALVISDHVMPGKNGVELLTDVSHDYRFLRTKKVLLTGQATHQDTITAINRARIESYIEKPWNASELLALATRLITEYIFDKGLEYTDYQEHLDQQVVLDRLR